MLQDAAGERDVRRSLQGQSGAAQGQPLPDELHESPGVGSKEVRGAEATNHAGRHRKTTETGCSRTYHTVTADQQDVCTAGYSLQGSQQVAQIPFRARSSALHWSKN